MSPHVMTPRERVRINNADITPEEFACVQVKYGYT
jgi:folylpolyglutamate synthase/dihydropteroate synthase